MSGIWNETAPNGGDSILDSPYMNGQYTPGDFAWILFASAFVWLMIPGIGYSASHLPLIHILGPEAVSSAESYRLAGLISQTHPYLGGNVQGIARACLESLRMAPGDGLVTASMPLLLMGSEQKEEEDQEFVLSKFRVLETTVGLQVMNRIKELVQEVWQRKDEGE